MFVVVRAGAQADTFDVAFHMKSDMPVIPPIAYPVTVKSSELQQFLLTKMINAERLGVAALKVFRLKLDTARANDLTTLAKEVTGS